MRDSESDETLSEVERASSLKYNLKWPTAVICNRCYHFHVIGAITSNVAWKDKGQVESKGNFNNQCSLSLKTEIHTVLFVHLYNFMLTLFLQDQWQWWSSFCILWHLYNSMTCICITCIILLRLIPHPIVIWLTYGSMECNKDICIYVKTRDIWHPELNFVEHWDRAL
jgi:hypothetical protein